MPVATTQMRSERLARPLKDTNAKSPAVKSPGKDKHSLRNITREEKDEWLAQLNEPSVKKHEFKSSEDCFEYPFKEADPVWIRTQDGTWKPGEVTGGVIRIGRTRTSKRGRYYPVRFGHKRNIRKYFAPGNADIKPNTPDVREMLWEESLIDLNSPDAMPYEESGDEGSTYTE